MTERQAGLQTERYRQTDRQTVGRTEKMNGRQTGLQTETERQTGSLTDKQNYGEIIKQTDRQTDRQKNSQSGRQKDRRANRQIDGLIYYFHISEIYDCLPNHASVTAIAHAH